MGALDTWLQNAQMASPAVSIAQAAMPLMSYANTGDWSGLFGAAVKPGTGAQWGGITDPNANALAIALKGSTLPNVEWTPDKVKAYWEAALPYYDEIAKTDSRSAWGGGGETSDGNWVFSPSSGFFDPEKGTGWISKEQWTDAMNRNIAAGGPPDISKYGTWAARSAPGFAERWVAPAMNLGLNAATGGTWGMMNSGFNAATNGNLGDFAKDLAINAATQGALKNLGIQDALKGALGDDLGNVATGAIGGGVKGAVRGDPVAGALGGAAGAAWNGTDIGQSLQGGISDALGGSLGNIVNKGISGGLVYGASGRDPLMGAAGGAVSPALNSAFGLIGSLFSGGEKEPPMSNDDNWLWEQIGIDPGTIDWTPGPMSGDPLEGLIGAPSSGASPGPSGEETFPPVTVTAGSDNTWTGNGMDDWLWEQIGITPESVNWDTTSNDWMGWYDSDLLNQLGLGGAGGETTLPEVVVSAPPETDLGASWEDIFGDLFDNVGTPDLDTQLPDLGTGGGSGGGSGSGGSGGAGGALGGILGKLGQWWKGQNTLGKLGAGAGVLALLGGLMNRGGSSGGGQMPNFPALFNPSSAPQGGYAPRVAISKPIDYYTYGQRPAENFFANVPAGTDPSTLYQQSGSAPFAQIPTNPTQAGALTALAGGQ